MILKSIIQTALSEEKMNILNFGFGNITTIDKLYKHQLLWGRFRSKVEEIDNGK